MPQLWTAIPTGDLKAGAGYMLRLTREGSAIMDGERGLDERVRLCSKLVDFRDLVGRSCTVHPWQTEAERRRENTIGTPTCVLLKRAKKAANPSAGTFGHRLEYE